MLSKGEVLEIRNADGSLHLARKTAHPDDWHPPVEVYDPYGPGDELIDDRRLLRRNGADARVWGAESRT